MTDHVLDDLEAFALGALDERTAESIAAHLSVCESCRVEASSLSDIVATLPDTVPAVTPRPLLRDRVLAAARADGRRQASAAPRGWSFGSVRAGPLVLAGLAAMVIVLGAADLDAYHRLTAMTEERDDYSAIVESLREGGRVWYMAGKDSFAGSGGTLIDPRADGRPPFVLFHDLPPIPKDTVLTVWLVSPDSTWARAATFVPNGRDVQAVQVNMEVSGFDRCAVTLEDNPWGPRHGVAVMEWRIVPPGQ
ncbi:MAG TPA: anti-sigma factor [Candidatus Polarisedimenticolia bacterium]|nr:anti-sigma factor [Candidatus Polarisedimenticolia bacterium]